MRIFIAGGGQVAAFIARRLMREGNSVTLVERDETRCQELNEILDAKIVHGSAASIRTWREAGIGGADMFIAVTHSDELNLLSCLIARDEAPDAVKALRLRTREFRTWQQLLQAQDIRVDRVVHPETDIVDRILRVLPYPGVSDVRAFADGAAVLFGMNVEAGSPLAGKSTRDLRRPDSAADSPPNAMVAMLFRDTEALIPRGDETIRPGDHVYLATTRASLPALMEAVGIRAQTRIGRVFIVGGGEVGVEVALALERQDVAVKLFEHNERRCEQIAEVLTKGVVIHGDGIDQETLWRENVAGVDAFIALTEDDHSNIIAALLSRRMGARKVVAQVNRINYLGMVERLGINTTVSPRLKAVDAVLEFVRKGGVLSVRSFGEEVAEAIELEAPADSKYVGRSLRDLGLPRDTIVAAIARPDGEVSVANGDSVIQPGDRVVFIALARSVGDLEVGFLAHPDNK